MRLRHRDGTSVHLAYCTNVHPAEDLDGVLAQLSRFAVPVRERLGVARLGLGLWLAREVASTLRDEPYEVERLRKELDHLDLEVVTLNGFPYRGFHGPVTKGAVYRPDWSEPERLRYTLDLAAVLAQLLPDDAARGSVSSVPLAWRTPWPHARARRAGEQLERLAEGLVAIERATGRTIRVGLEPEPGCVVETTAQAAEHLGRHAGQHLGVCLDTCHLAVAFEDPAAAVARLRAAGLPVVKVQASAALHVDDPAEPAQRRALAAFAEPRFLHQVRTAGGGAYDDLPDALGAAGNDRAATPGSQAWRVHFHVPLHAEPAAPLRSTRAELDRTLGVLFAGPSAVADHVEVETYTWGVLPQGARPGTDDELAAGIADELRWTYDRLLDHGLEERT